MREQIENWGPFGATVIAASGLLGADVVQGGAMELDGYLTGVALLLVAWEARAARAQVVGALMPLAESLLEELAALRAAHAETRSELAALSDSLRSP